MVVEVKKGQHFDPDLMELKDLVLIKLNESFSLGGDDIRRYQDRMTKSAHFINVKSTYRAEDYTRLYIDEIMRWHGIPLSIISDRGAQFTSHFWRSFQKILGMQTNLSTSFHPQTDGKEERTIQTLEDMFSEYVIDFRGS